MVYQKDSPAEKTPLMTAHVKHIFFDMDGTLVDASLCFINCVRYALTSLGFEVNNSLDLTRFIGPPILGTFQTLMPNESDALIALAIERYRARFVAVGIFEAHAYPETANMLAHLRNRGLHQSVVTNRAQPLAQQTLEHLQLAQHFRGIFGPALADTTSTKVDLFGQAMCAEGLGRNEVVMVGDRSDDIIAAKAHGVRCISVTWGFGKVDELSECGPDYIVSSPAELLDCLDTLAESRPI